MFKLTKVSNNKNRFQTDYNTNGYSNYLLARDANIGEATRSPTIKADDKTPSSKLFNLKSPLHTSRQIVKTIKLHVNLLPHITI